MSLSVHQGDQCVLRGVQSKGWHHRLLCPKALVFSDSSTTKWKTLNMLSYYKMRVTIMPLKGSHEVRWENGYQALSTRPDKMLHLPCILAATNCFLFNDNRFKRVIVPSPSILQKREELCKSAKLNSHPGSFSYQLCESKSPFPHLNWW